MELDFSISYRIFRTAVGRRRRRRRRVALRRRRIGDGRGRHAPVTAAGDGSRGCCRRRHHRRCR